VSLKLVTGPPNAAKSGVTLGAFREFVDAGLAPFLVVPTAADRDSCERELLEGGALIGGRVVTWEAFVRGLARGARVPGRVIGPLRRRLIVRELVEARLAAGDLVALASSARAPGFPVALERLLLEHSRGLIDDAALLELPAGGSRARAEETVALVGDYFSRLDGEGLIDRDLQARRALSALVEDPSIWPGRPVIVHGFSDLTAVQSGTVSALSGACEVIVSLPARGDGLGVGMADISADHLRQMVDLPGGFVEETLEPSSEPNGSLDALAAALFTQARGGCVEDDGKVAVLSGSGSRATAELAGGSVVDLIADGIAPEAIAIVRPHSDDDALIASILESAGVEVARPESAPLSATTLGRALIGLCRTVFEPETAVVDDALAWIRVIAGSDRALIVDSIEADLRRKGANRADTAMAAWASASSASSPDRERLRRHVSKQDLADALAICADRLMRSGPLVSGKRLMRDTLFDANVVTAVAKAASDLADLFDRNHPRLMIEELGAIEVELDSGSPRPGAVQLTDPSSIRARQVDAIVLLGLEHGVFPAAAAQDPFLADTPSDRIREGERVPTQGADPRLLSSAARQEAGERERFAACFARARERVVLVRRVRDDAGSRVAGSVYLDEVLRLLGRPLEAAEGESDIRLAGSVIPFSRSAAGRAAAREQALSDRLTAPDRPVSQLGEEVRALIAAQYESVVSPSRLESYCECPMSWLGQNLLNPAEMEPESEPTFRGTVVHFALQRAVQAAIENGDGRIEQKVMDDARQAVRDAIAEKAAEAADTIAAAVALQRAEILSMQWLDRECDRDWEAKAIATEFEFGDSEGDVPPLDIGEGIRLRGTVDRVDSLGVSKDDRRLLVRDYKSGNKVWPQEQWEADRRLQPPLYLLAAMRLLGGKPAAALYESIKSGNLTGAIVEGTPGAGNVGRSKGQDLVPAEELDGLIEAACERARVAVRGIRDGFVAPDPAHCSQGYGCRFPWLCRTVR
jgi:RecB family exonuclease